jgi:hypothetical protein
MGINMVVNIVNPYKLGYKPHNYGETYPLITGMSTAKA